MESPFGSSLKTVRVIILFKYTVLEFKLTRTIKLSIGRGLCGVGFAIKTPSQDMHINSLAHSLQVGNFVDIEVKLVMLIIPYQSCF